MKSNNFGGDQTNALRLERYCTRDQSESQRFDFSESLQNFAQFRRLSHESSICFQRLFLTNSGGQAMRPRATVGKGGVVGCGSKGRSSMPTDGCTTESGREYVPPVRAASSSPSFLRWQSSGASTSQRAQRSNARARVCVCVCVWVWVWVWVRVSVCVCVCVCADHHSQQSLPPLSHVTKPYHIRDRRAFESPRNPRTYAHA